MATVLKSLPTVVGTFKTYVQGNHSFTYTVDANTGRWYVCWAAKDLGVRIPSKFVEEMQNQFEARQYNTAQLQRPGLQRTQEEFVKEMQALMEKFNDRSVASMDRLEAMRASMREINDNLMEGLERLLERGEKIELLVHRTEELTTQTNMFRQAAREARNRAWWQEKSYIACFIIVLLCLIMLIVFSICGITFSKCRAGR